MNNLIISTLKTSIIGLIVFGLLLFLPAWTLAYWQAWVFLIVFTVSTQILGIYLLLKNPVLLERRKRIGPWAEQSVAQKIIISFAFITCIALLIFCSLDYRFGWSPVPALVSLLGDVLVAVGLLTNLLVFRENTYVASTVETFADQKVISTGLYAIVRHPLYVGVLVMMIGIPLALDSWWGLASIALIVPVLVWRILDEESFLKKDLPGYSDYTHKVRYRLVPYVW